MKIQFIYVLFPFRYKFIVDKVFKMIDKEKRMIIAGVMYILIDVFNLAEQIAVYFITKQSDLSDTDEQRFFFILFAVGGALAFKPLFLHPFLKTLFSICIEIGELVSYLTLLSRTTSLLVVTILFFSLQIIFYLISLVDPPDDEKDYCKDFVTHCCSLPSRIIAYGVIFETQILFLFLDPDSPFRGTYYEVLMIFVTFFGLSTVERIGVRWSNNDESEDENFIYKIFQSFLALLNAIEAPIILITALVFASQSLEDREQLKTYDFVIYIIVIIAYGSSLLILTLALLCALCLCAGVLLKFVLDCFTSKN